MKVIQDAEYIISEWDGMLALVRVRNIGRGARTHGYRTDGKPHLRSGGDVLMEYRDGVTHRVSAAHFEGLSPRLAIFAILGA